MQGKQVDRYESMSSQEHPSHSVNPVIRSFKQRLMYQWISNANLDRQNPPYIKAGNFVIHFPLPLLIVHVNCP
jgi:hypothetical protein